MAYTITLVDETNNKTTKTTPGQKLFYFDNVKTQMKRGYYEDSSNQKRMIYQYDIIPPTLTVDNPKGASSSNPTYIGSSSYTVNGTVKDTESGVESVTVNGKAATVNGNNYSCTLTGISATAVTPIKVIATDVAGNTSTVTKYLRYDNEKPTISINAPGIYDAASGSYFTFSDSVPIGGTVTDSLSGVQSITVQGSAASLSGTNFSSRINLVVGNRTTVKVTAKDKAGNVSEKIIYVTRTALTLGQWEYSGMVLSGGILGPRSTLRQIWADGGHTAWDDEDPNSFKYGSDDLLFHTTRMCPASCSSSWHNITEMYKERKVHPQNLSNTAQYLQYRYKDGLSYVKKLTVNLKSYHITDNTLCAAQCVYVVEIRTANGVLLTSNRGTNSVSLDIDPNVYARYGKVYMIIRFEQSDLINFVEQNRATAGRRNLCVKFESIYCS